MPRPRCDPLTLFSLIPWNARAEEVIAHPCNSHLVSIWKGNTLAFDIGSHIRSRARNTLATLGRSDTDIILEGSSIARFQCSFEIAPDTGVVMLYDRSHRQTTQVFGPVVVPFEHGRIRRVLVQNNLNTIVGMGGVGCNLILFKLIWHQDPTQTAQMIKKQAAMFSAQEENPRIARTANETPIDLQSRMSSLKMRHMTLGNELGRGQFGRVYKAIDVDSGKFMAVKEIYRPTQKTKEEEWRFTLPIIKREVEALSQIQHPHIVDYITSQGWEGPTIEIFMGLKDGTLESLIESGDDLLTVADSVFPQMLRALDYLAYNGVVHRDVKPANILYTSLAHDQYLFQLGDFGLCNRAISAVTTAGTPLYMAPEMFLKGQQSSKVDVWSLFVTMLWTLDVRDFRHCFYRFKTSEDVWDAIVLASKMDQLSNIQEMAVVSPEKRASAAQMLVRLYRGEGLSTPQDRVWCT